MRLIPAAALFIMVLVLGTGPAAARQAYQGQWCAITSQGRGVVEHCQYNSIEACRPNVIAGNRGFCGLNPRWEGNNAPAAVPRARKKRHARRH
jgi:hypothetical protein